MFDEDLEPEDEPEGGVKLTSMNKNLCNIRDGKSAKHDEIDENDDIDVSFVFDCNESEVIKPTTSAAAMNDDIVSSQQSLSNNMNRITQNGVKAK